MPVITNTTVTEIIDFSESEIIKTNLCSVFPNPCKDVFTVKSENAICKIVVENTLGQVVREISVNEQNETKIDLSNEKNGLYLIKLYTADGVEISKILKTK